MKSPYRLLSFILVLLVSAAVSAQTPGPPPGGGRRQPVDPTQLAIAAVNRLMKFDANGDGQLSKQELNDSRLEAMFQQADTNRDGVLTKEEVSLWATKEAAILASTGRGGPGGVRPSGAGPRGPFPDGPPMSNGPPPRRP